MARIRHLAIVSENRERLVKFYTEGFGMKVIEGVVLKHPGTHTLAGTVVDAEQLVLVVALGREESGFVVIQRQLPAAPVMRPCEQVPGQRKGRVGRYGAMARRG